MGHCRSDITYRYDQGCYLVHYRPYRSYWRQTPDERGVLCHRTESSGISGLYWNCCRSAGSDSDRNACDDNRHGQMEGNICIAGSRSTHSCNSLRLDHCSTTSFSIACEIYLPNFKCCSGCSYHFYRFECKAGKKTTKKSKNIKKSAIIRLQRKDRHAIM